MIWLGRRAGGARGVVLSVDPRIEPNFAIYALIAGLIRLTGYALLANSIFLMLYGLIWVVAAFAIAHTESKKRTLAVLLLLPLAFGRFIHLGFYNYALGVPLFLLFAVFRRRLAGRHDVGALVATAVFSFALCMTHVTAAVVPACRWPRRVWRPPLARCGDPVRRSLREHLRSMAPGRLPRRCRPCCWSEAF